jgi:hypothetical protein
MAMHGAIANNFLRRPLTILFLGGLLALLLAGCVNAPTYQDRQPPAAAPGSPTLAVQPGQGSGGQQVQVLGTNWPANQLIMVHLEDEQGRSGFMAAANTDAAGQLITGFTWPVSQRWQQPGTVQVVANSPGERHTAETTFTVLAPGQQAPVAEDPPAEEIPAEEAPTPEATPSPDEPTPTPLPALAVAPPIASPDVDAFWMETPPVLDGDLSEWVGIQGYLSPFIVEQHPEWHGNLDVEAIWRLGWDENALYFGVSVADDLIVQENIPQFAYFGDSLEIELATDIANRGNVVTRRDFQYIISPGNFRDLPPAAYRFQGTPEGRLTDAPGTLARVAALRTERGYNLEFSIPWSDINVTAHSGFAMGAALNVNDNDVPGSVRIQYLMLSNVSTRQWSTPSSWGTLTLR